MHGAQDLFELLEWKDDPGRKPLILLGCVSSAECLRSIAEISILASFYGRTGFGSKRGPSRRDGSQYVEMVP